MDVFLKTAEVIRLNNSIPELTPPDALQNIACYTKARFVGDSYRQWIGNFNLIYIEAITTAGIYLYYFAGVSLSPFCIRGRQIWFYPQVRCCVGRWVQATSSRYLAIDSPEMM